MNTAKANVKNIEWDGRSLEFDKGALVMGILNVTPDSFSDGGDFFSPDAAVAQGEKLVEDGAAILDIGGESTRPFADDISGEEETRRVIPVLEKLVARVDVPISIDTTKTSVARRALDAGASIINDVGAFRLDPDLADLAAARDVPVILMHMKGVPRTMQVDPHYDDLMAEVKGFLAERIEFAVSRGVDRDKIIVDPGIGFGKTVAHNLELIRRLREFDELDAPVLVGLSRKAFIRNLLKDRYGKEFHPQDPEVETGTQAALCATIMNGAHIVRVHDVANTKPTVAICEALRTF